MQFISFTGKPSSETKKAQRKIVRSHVTAQRYRKKRKEDEEAYRLNNPPAISIPLHVSAETGIDTSPVSNYHDTESRGFVMGISVQQSATGKQLNLTKTPSEISGSGGPFDFVTYEDSSFFPTVQYSISSQGSPFNDPFIGMPPALSPRLFKHLFYYVNVLMPQMNLTYFANQFRKRIHCPSLATSDELSLSGMSAFSATSRAMLINELTKGHDAESLHLKWRTIKLVTGRLANTITGNTVEATTHMKGLQQLAGIRRQNSNPIPYDLAAKIVTSAVKLAAMTHTTPLVPFVIGFNITLPISNVSHVLPDLGSKLISDWPNISKVSDPFFISTLYDMANMTRHTEAVYEVLYPFTEDDSYYQYINAQNLHIEHRLLSYSPGNKREDCVRLACILFVNTCLVRGFPISAAILQNLVAVLRNALRSSLKTNDWESHKDVLFWVLCVSAFCTKKETEDGVLVNAFVNVASQLNLDSWEDAKKLLCSFFYVERIYGEKFRHTWDNKCD
ncbi:hypothetical protein K504DRAFT_506968 [Pleomassaria siparia CBS 279.74]|uniref:Tachykinin family protein n=1 Tax=Pleomassaria siparia CBS 279.74 TaxID=1314801 RepID=A0A6G1JWE0_9PLEO|nr:hypothetical protein K504DRAFT_506968 [Pleomassaria siparia CBS 279.74]